MKGNIFFILVSLAIGIATPRMAKCESSWIEGTWKYIGFIYNSEFHHPLDPNLVLIFEFKTDGSDSLSWKRTGESGFCERRGQYSVEENILHDEVLWLNPNNSRECGQDPDMMIGKKTTNEIRLIDGHIHLYLGLAGEPLIYVLEPVLSLP